MPYVDLQTIIIINIMLPTFQGRRGRYPVLEELFRQYANRLRQYLQKKTNDPDLSADIVQEAFTRIARHHDLSAIANQPSYLFRTANNLLIDHLRQTRTRATDSLAPLVLDTVVDPNPGPEQLAGKEEEMDRLRDILLSLPPVTRAVFQLSRIQGLTRDETASHLGISTSSVQKHLVLAITAISRGLEQAEP